MDSAWFTKPSGTAFPADWQPWESALTQPARLRVSAFEVAIHTTKAYVLDWSPYLEICRIMSDIREVGQLSRDFPDGLANTWARNPAEALEGIPRAARERISKEDWGHLAGFISDNVLPLAKQSLKAINAVWLPCWSLRGHVWIAVAREKTTVEPKLLLRLSAASRPTRLSGSPNPFKSILSESGSAVAPRRSIAWLR